MIDFTGLIGRIVGKGQQAMSDALTLGSRDGIATGSEFGALVKLAAQAQDGGAGAATAPEVLATELPAASPPAGQAAAEDPAPGANNILQFVLPPRGRATSGPGSETRPATDDADPSRVTPLDPARVAKRQDAGGASNIQPETQGTDFTIAEGVPTPMLDGQAKQASSNNIEKADGKTAVSTTVGEAEVPVAQAGNGKRPTMSQNRAAEDEASAPVLAASQDAVSGRATTAGDPPVETAGPTRKPRKISREHPATDIVTPAPTPTIALSVQPPVTAPTPAIAAESKGSPAATSTPAQPVLAAAVGEEQTAATRGKPGKTEIRTVSLKDSPASATARDTAKPTAASAAALGEPAEAARTSATAVAQTGSAGGKAEVSSSIETGNPARADTAKPNAAALDNAAVREIVQSLPPMVQSQLAASGTASAAQAAPSAAEQISAQVVDMAVDGQWIDRLAREIVGLAENNGHSRFQLSPAHLGKIQVDVWQGAEATDVRFLAETDEAANRLHQGRGELAADARMAALPIGTIAVERASAPLDAGRDQNQNQTQSQGQTNGSQQGFQAQAGTGRGRDGQPTGPDHQAGRSQDDDKQTPAPSGGNRRWRYA